MSYEWPGTEAEKKIAELIVAQTGGYFVSIVTTSGGERVSGTERLGVKAGKGTIEVKALLEAALSSAEPVRWMWEERRFAESDIWDDMYDDEEPAPHEYVRNVRPLYTAPPALTAQVQDVAVPEGWQLVPKDDESRCVADSALPHEMIEAGIRVQEQVNDDNCNYISGETTDWDCGMVAVAIYRAMIAAAPAKQEGKP